MTKLNPLVNVHAIGLPLHYDILLIIQKVLERDDNYQKEQYEIFYREQLKKNDREYRALQRRMRNIPAHLYLLMNGFD
jgi:hypothetical protein